MNAGTKAAIGAILALTGGGMIFCIPLFALLRPNAIDWLNLFCSVAFYAVMLYAGLILIRKSKYKARKSFQSPHQQTTGE
jgi:hypothetical protein